MQYVYSGCAILLCLAAGYGFNALISIIPPSLFGMMVLAFSLVSGWLNPHYLEATIAWIIRNMGVCFVPAGVGIMDHFELIKTDGPIMMAITIVTTFLLMFMVGWIFQTYGGEVIGSNDWHILFQLFC